MLTGKELGDAIASAIKLKGCSQKALAAHFGIKPPSVQDWIKRGTIDKSKLLKLWAFFSDVVGPEHWGLSSYPVEGTPVAAIDEGDPLGEEYIQIRESEVRFAAGNGRTPLFDEVVASVPRTYRRDWFIKEGINPEHARCFKVHGDSMESFLFDGDSVLVNLAEKEIINGKVYALRYGEELRIKRVYKKLDGGLILHSDNPNHRPIDEDISPASAEESISIIGRVRDKSGTGGL